MSLIPDSPLSSTPKPVPPPAATSSSSSPSKTEQYIQEGSHLIKNSSILGENSVSPLEGERIVHLPSSSSNSESIPQEALNLYKSLQECQNVFILEEEIKSFIAQYGKDNPYFEKLVEKICELYHHHSDSTLILERAIRFLIQDCDKKEDPSTFQFSNQLFQIYKQSNSRFELAPGTLFFESQWGEKHPYTQELIQRQREISTQVRAGTFTEQTNPKIDLESKKLTALNHPQSLSSTLFTTFTTQDILNDPPFFDFILEKALAQCPPEEKGYLQKHILYLNRLKEEKTFSKDCHHWECLGKDPEGTSWIFKLKWKHDVMAGGASREPNVVADANFEIEPATEPTLNFFKIPEVQDPYLQSLGFRWEFGKSGMYLTIPSIETLQANWRVLQTTLPGLELANFTFKEVDGISSSEAFIQDLNENDVIISRDKEFVHDMIIHVMSSMFALIKDVEAYQNARMKMRQIGMENSKALELARQKYQEEPEKIAAIEILREMLAILYDTTITYANASERDFILTSWENGEFITHFWSIPGDKFVLKDPEMRKHLKQLGMSLEDDFTFSPEHYNRGDYNQFNFPAEKLLQLRKQFQAEMAAA